jgi:D-alanyl-D-alanine dipeptidase
MLAKRSNLKMTGIIKVEAKKHYLEELYDSLGLVKISNFSENILYRPAYSDTLNFLKINLYKSLKTGYLPLPVLQQLIKAQSYLDSLSSCLKLIVYDGVRPLHVQQMMWDSLKLPNHQKYGYIAAPSYNSLHNYGCAVDVGIDSCGIEWDFGTRFDTFDSLSAPVCEGLFLKTKRLSHLQYQHRVILRKAMHAARFYGITSEWWHFNYCSLDQAKLNFVLIK